ncbi:MAG: phosphoribosylamine---glycine ligase [Actinomycetota bacterium]|nr:phosphoribosylamine---glycine ligase [Actinomycetota bacterium]
MRVLVVGGGGREHALVWSLSKSSLVADLLCAPGNPGIQELARCRPVAVDDLPAMVTMAAREFVDLVVVGPEAPLVGGLADALREAGIRVFGPGAAGARLEGSKGWAKSLMAAAGIPTAAAQSFDRADEAIAYARLLLAAGTGVVVKADGLAAGKGVTVCDDDAQAAAAITDALDRRVFGAAGSRVLVEERLAGEELSVLAFSDGKTVLPMQAAQDFKRAHDGDLGPNTGGMGSHSPVPSCTPDVAGRITDQVLEPVAAALAAEGEPYVGVIYAGIMLTPDGPKVLEFNCRFGDPETQALLPRLASDLMEPILACTDGTLSGVRLDWRPDACVAVVAAAAGYPGSPSTGAQISGLEGAEALTGLPVFQAGTRPGPDGSVVTSGGRVLAVAALGDAPWLARRRAYDGLAKVSFDGMWYRSDIGPRPGFQAGSAKGGLG